MVAHSMEARIEKRYRIDQVNDSHDGFFKSIAMDPRGF
jgi:hypothetical protein